ncbi:ABC transporter ATP-binding protein [Nonomuraea sp. NPDC050663]|uniref:ABC transporter ATP-binding protein n=1 Tax=Nonomuraea sp. NPDC050663 TaxID=3364370 RepID=UPI0037A45201
MTALGLAWQARPVLLAAQLAGALITGATPVALAWLTKQILDELLGQQRPIGWLVGQGALLAGLGLIAAAIPHLLHYVDAEMGRSVRLYSQDRLYAALSRLDGLSRFEDPVFHDRIRLAQQAGEMSPPMILDATLGGVRTVVIVLGFSGSLLAASPAMTAMLLVSAIPVVAAELSLSNSRGRMMWTISPHERRQVFYSQLMTDRTAAKEVRLFGLADFIRTRMLSELRQVNAAQRRLDRRVFRTQFALTALTSAVAGTGLVWGIVQARAGLLAPGDLIVFIAAVAGVQTGLSGLVTQLASGHQALLLFSHYLAILNAEPDLPTPAHPVPASPLHSAIKLRDVWFRYDLDKPWVLRGVNLEIPAGSLLALVGVNGAGKSTLVKLLCRLYEPTRGSISWDGVDIRDIPVADLRGRIGTVFQDHMNYDFTAADNIGIGDLPSLHNLDRIRVAAVSAEVHATIAALPHGYETLLSRMFFMGSDSNSSATGMTLSGGQWQRIALARGLMRGRRDLLILDEPSSGLDAEAEHTIHQRLVELRHGTTSVIISHRLNGVRMADRIAILDDGCITEHGTHDELMERDGSYARLFRMQASGYDTGHEPLPTP